MAITPTAPIVKTETIQIPQTSTKTYDQVGVEAIMFRWANDNAGGKITAICRLRPFISATGELSPPGAIKPLIVDDLMAAAAADAELASIMTQLYAKVGAMAKTVGII